jgi:DNA invertase Pin-like site-specific DNA recombinase
MGPAWPQRILCGQGQVTIPNAHKTGFCKYVNRRGWTIALHVREVNSGAARREAREKLLEAARRREIHVVLVWRLDRWGRSVTDLLAPSRNWNIWASGSSR